MAEKTGVNFWRGVKGLTCVCGTYRCDDEEECRLVKHMLKQVQQWRNKKEQERSNARLQN